MRMKEIYIFGLMAGILVGSGCVLVYLIGIVYGWGAFSVIRLLLIFVTGFLGGWLMLILIELFGDTRGI